MNRMMPKSFVIAAIASLMFATSGCVSKSAYDTKVRELQTQVEHAQERAEDLAANARLLQKEAEANSKLLADEIERLKKDLAAAKAATEKAEKEAMEAVTEVKGAARKAKRDDAEKIKALEGEIATAKEAAAKAEQARKEAETKLKALEEKQTPKTPTDAKSLK